MKARENEVIKNRILRIVTAALLAALIALVAGLIYVFSESSATNEDFDINMITAESSESADITGTLIPEFIGISSEGKRKGIAFSDMILLDIMKTVAPTVSYVMSAENARESDEYFWNSLSYEQNSVYIRFHTELPETVVGLYFDRLAGNGHGRSGNQAYVSEMFITPYSSDGNGKMSVAVRSEDGRVFVYSAEDPHTFITSGEIATIMRSYSVSLVKFMFAGSGFSGIPATEPIIIDGVSPKKLKFTGRTGDLNSSDEEKTALLKLFGMNPDKVRQSQSEDDGTASYIDSFGVLYVRDSSIEYKASSDGGVKVRDITGSLTTKNIDIEEYIRAAVTIFDTVRGIDRDYAGGEADVYLSSVSAQDGHVTVGMTYSFENIPISENRPALKAVFYDGVLKEADIWAVSFAAKSSKTDMMSEWGFASNISARGVIPVDIGTVYVCDTADGTAEAEWRAKVPRADQ